MNQQASIQKEQSLALKFLLKLTPEIIESLPLEMVWQKMGVVSVLSKGERSKCQQIILMLENREKILQQEQANRKKAVKKLSSIQSLQKSKQPQMMASRLQAIEIAIKPLQITNESLPMIAKLFSVSIKPQPIMTKQKVNQAKPLPTVGKLQPISAESQQITTNPSTIRKNKEVSEKAYLSKKLKDSNQQSKSYYSRFRQLFSQISSKLRKTHKKGTIFQEDLQLKHFTTYQDVDH